MSNALENSKARKAEMREALEFFHHLYYPVCTTINPSGYEWRATQEMLEAVKEKIDAALASSEVSSNAVQI